MRQANMEQGIQVVAERDVKHSNIGRYTAWSQLGLIRHFGQLKTRVDEVTNLVFRGISAMEKFEPYKYQLEL